MFGQGFQFKLPEGHEDKLNSPLGFFLTIILFILVIAYACIKLQILIEFDDTKISQTTLDSNFEIDDKITSDDGIAFAFAFTSYDNSTEQLDPDYGEVDAVLWQWGFDEEFGNTWNKLSTRPCTLAELGLTELKKGEREYLYPSHKNAKNEVAYYADKFRCLSSHEKVRI